MFVLLMLPCEFLTQPSRNPISTDHPASKRNYSQFVKWNQNLIRLFNDTRPFLRGPLNSLFKSLCAFMAYHIQHFNTPKNISISFRDAINMVLVYYYYRITVYYSYIIIRKKKITSFIIRCGQYYDT